MLACFNFRAGMFVYGLAFLTGIVLLQQYSVLPSRIAVALSTTCLFICSYFSWKSFLHWSDSDKKPVVEIKHRVKIKYAVKIVFVLALLIQLGFLVAFVAGERALNNRLDDRYVGTNILINGVIASIPTTSGESQRFEFIVDDYHLADDQNDLLGCAVNCLSRTKFPEKIRLSWYFGNKVNADERWQFEVRLKPPHGFMNPGGFDYEKWLFQKGISATGYVRKSDDNKRLQTASTYSINRFRQSLASQIDQLEETSDRSTLSMIKALAIGDKSSMSKQQWQVLTNTGTSHLMAISGLHIGLAALFSNILVRRSVPIMFLKYFPAQHVALIAGVFTAVLYALVAGLSVPTQRALIMLIVLTLLLLLRRNHRPLDALGFALVAVLLFDPLAVLSIGFWFSFSAVAAIFISVTRGVEEYKNVTEEITKIKKIRKRVTKILGHWMRLQIVLSLFLLPLSLFMFQQVSLVSPLANLLLIPYVSFLVVPVVLLAILFSLILPVVSNALFELAAVLLDLIWPMLSSLSSQTFSLWEYSDIGIIELFVTSFIFIALYFSKQLANNVSKTFFVLWSIRSLLSVILLSCFVRVTNGQEGRLGKGEIKLTVLDVGQGSSAVIQTRSHVLVFDAGAKFSNKLGTGKNIIIPFLNTENINVLDALIVSHGDADHIGGAQALLDEYPETKLIGQDIAKLTSDNKQLCYSGIEWRWDGVDFKFLSPEMDMVSKNGGRKQSRNNHSCVLHVSSNSGSVLLTGDIENTVEQKLLKKYQNQLASDVLIVPHHGSNTSSIMPFIAAVNPKLSIISAGYNNRYHLPNHRVLKRYSQHHNGLNNRVLKTYSSGAIKLILKEGVEIEYQQFRENARKYWHH